jgi:hypothetical protein
MSLAAMPELDHQSDQSAHEAEINVGEILMAAAELSPIVPFVSLDVPQAVEQAFGMCTPRQQVVLTQLLGLNGKGERSPEEVANNLPRGEPTPDSRTKGVSTQRVSQLKKAGLEIIAQSVLARLNEREQMKIAYLRLTGEL